ncbi:MAG: hypothetical protein PHS23_05680 [Candidatus Cloacimonetes bacterium]|nr:hypothetical protein [Candidatus Cloacimonadota bacterium]
MKKFCLGLSMLIMFMGLWADTGIRGIRAEDYQGVVCRLVLDLNQDAKFTVQQKPEGLQINIENFDGRDAKKQLNSSLIRELQVNTHGVWVATIKGLRYEMMQLSETRQAVVDLFSNPQNLEGKLAIARFYSDRGKYASADEAFYALDRGYPGNDNVLYYWGILLKRRGSNRANVKLGQIPESSPYFDAAQELIQSGRYIPQLQEADVQASIEADALDEVALRDSIYKVDSLVVAAPKLSLRHPKPKALDVIAEIASQHFILALLVFVSTLVIISILVFGSRQGKTKKTESSIGLEAMALQRMVHRLLADGWTHKEIARELKIGVNDVTFIANQAHPPADESESNDS